MDMNQFMQHIVDMQIRQTVALEALAKHAAGYEPSGKPMPATSAEVAATAVAGNKPATEADNEKARKSAADAQAKAAAARVAADKKAADEKAAKEKADAEAKAAAEAKALEEALGGDEPAKAPKLSIDDVRTALKAYAAANGNPAAMKLLADHGAASVSALEQDKYADFVAACA